MTIVLVMTTDMAIRLMTNRHIRLIPTNNFSLNKSVWISSTKNTIRTTHISIIYLMPTRKNEKQEIPHWHLKAHYLWIKKDNAQSPRLEAW